MTQDLSFLIKINCPDCRKLKESLWRAIITEQK